MGRLVVADADIADSHRVHSGTRHQDGLEIASGSIHAAGNGMKVTGSGEDSRSSVLSARQAVWTAALIHLYLRQYTRKHDTRPGEVSQDGKIRPDTVALRICCASPLSSVRSSGCTAVLHER